MAMAFTLAHISDLHVGRLRDAHIEEALIEDLHTVRPDLVVVSGDLTQRARRRQFLRARRFLDRMALPLLVIPGNHDVPAWYRPIERLRHPFRRYRRYIQESLHVGYETSEVAVFGLNTAHGRTIKSGMLFPEGLAAMETFFRRQPAERLRILTVHHPPVALPEIGQPSAIPEGEPLLLLAQSLGVRLILTGHWHHAWVKPLPAYGLWLLEAGTALSSRGRGSYRGVNSYFLLRIERDTFQCMERWYNPALHRFESHCLHTYPLAVERFNEVCTVPLPRT